MPRRRIQEQVTLIYENAEHRQYAELVSFYGFSMIVSPSLQVGRRFVHPTKLHEVELDTTDDGGREMYEPKLWIWTRPRYARNGLPERPKADDFVVPVYPEHYSTLEWQEINRDTPDSLTALERELHIWLRVRPYSLNSQLQVDHAHITSNW